MFQVMRLLFVWMFIVCTTRDDVNMKGVIPKAISQIFDKKEKMKNSKIEVHASFYELYDEVIDLLTGPEVTKKMSVRYL